MQAPSWQIAVCLTNVTSATKNIHLLTWTHYTMNKNTSYCFAHLVWAQIPFPRGCTTHRTDCCFEHMKDIMVAAGASVFSVSRCFFVDILEGTFVHEEAPL